MTSNVLSDRPSAFDQVASKYDREFTDTRLARALRDIVWARLAAHVEPGMRVLEIGCGTGEDAVWLAKQGVQVIATDASPAMLAVTRHKAQQAGVAGLLATQVLDAASPLSRPAGEGPEACPRQPFAAVRLAFSNFGALNCVRDLRPIAVALGDWLPPGGSLVLVFINRWCAWEMFWHVLHRQPHVAFRRLRRDGVEARVGDGWVHTWYPSLGAIRTAFAPAFDLKRVTGLGVFLPPSYLEPIVVKRPRLFRLLARLERATATLFPFKLMADHIIVEFERSMPYAIGDTR
jgi:SAM-dependent methyltransferase